MEIHHTADEFPTSSSVVVEPILKVIALHSICSNIKKRKRNEPRFINMQVQKIKPKKPNKLNI